MTAATYQYVDLPDASVVTTRALLAARENITDTVAARAMMCIHGGAGFGKTLAVNTCLRALEPGEDVRKITFRARPTARAVRYELFTALDLAGEPPRHPSEFDRLLKMALAERPRTFLVDEAQWLNGEACGLEGYVQGGGCFSSGVSLMASVGRAWFRRHLNDGCRGMVVWCGGAVS
ncbi:ATP-binding protein [Streptomyces sp. NPDC006314]|uniref:ATP-binding protein n=1 Tax=Streptomyces sp. NPDC006314 TaxID=3154475 RepID=UPI0033B6AE98